MWLPQPAGARIRVPPGKRGLVRAEIARARQRLQSARRSDSPEEATDLARQALGILLLVVAAVEPEGPIPAGTLVPGHAVRRVQSTLPRDDEDLVDVLASFTEAPPPFVRPFPLLPPTAADVARLTRLCLWTEALLDLRSQRQHRLRRALRAAMAGAAVALVVSAVFGDRNLARGMKVTASSLVGYTPAPPLGKDGLYRLVDGERVERAIVVEWAHGTYAMATEMRPHPWVTVDLGTPRTIDRVVVYNRSDCCWGVNDLPVSVQISQDNVNFVTVATRTVPFMDDFPWRVSIGRRRARYVRLWNPSEAPKELVLNEIEVYGR